MEDTLNFQNQTICRTAKVNERRASKTRLKTKYCSDEHVATKPETLKARTMLDKPETRPNTMRSPICTSSSALSPEISQSAMFTRCTSTLLFSKNMSSTTCCQKSESATNSISLSCDGDEEVLCVSENVKTCKEISHDSLRTWCKASVDCSKHFVPSSTASGYFPYAPAHRKRVNRIGSFVASLIMTLTFVQIASCLETGEHPPYDTLCLTSGQLIPLMWDCSGYVQCMPLGGGMFKAVWTQCTAGRSFDPTQMACVLQYDKCPTAKDSALNICPAMPNLKFPHPSSCTLYYDCSKPTSRPGLEPWENECPDPLLFDEKTFTCKERTPGDKQFCGSRPEPNGKCDYRLGCRDKNCTSVADGPDFDPLAPFSVYFYQCVNGSAVAKRSCEEEGHIFDPHIRECTDAVHEESVAKFCSQNPLSIFADPTRCSLFYDCAQASWHPSLKSYQTECSYPRLFDPKSSNCASFHDVSCGKRPETIQPCDYAVGHCIDAGCIPCVASCLGLPNGPNAYPGRVLTAFYLVCERERTMDIRTCADGTIFDPQMRTCLSELSTQTVDIYCAGNPDGRLTHPSECSIFYSCNTNKTQTNPNLPPRAIECKYPYLVDSGTVTCKPHTLVKCGSRREPFSPCDYVSNRCISQACTKCELVLPSCYGKADNYYPAINQEMTANYIVCKDQRVMGSGVCPSGTIFDIRTLTCTDTVYSLSLLEFCTNYNTGRVQNPLNCAQYYDCAISLTEVAECTYPDLYDVTSHLCLPYDQVKCGGRPKFLDPCDSFTFCPVQPCPYCNSAYPSCVGRNGQIGGFRFEPSMFYECVDDRLALRYCQTTYNATARACNEMISPVSQVQVISVSTTTSRPLTTTTIHPNALQDNILSKCAAMPQLILYKNDNCAQFYNCSHPSSPLGEYVDECAVGALFNSSTNQCQPYNEVTCYGRYEPEQACDYQRNCLNETEGCPQCQSIYPSCVNVTNGLAPSQVSFAHALVQCRNGRALNVTTCPIGQFYDKTLKACTGVLSDSTTKATCRTKPDELLPHPIHCGKYIKCGKTPGSGDATNVTYTIGECPYPLLFTDGLCRSYKSALCGFRKEAIKPCDYDALRKCPDKGNNCRVGSADTCPDKLEHSCLPCEERYPSCVGRPNGLSSYPGRLFTSDFIRCDLGRTLAILKCTKSIFNPVVKRCGLTLDAVLTEAQKDIVSFCQRYPDSILPHPTHCARFYNCSSPVTNDKGEPTYLEECPHPQLFDSKMRMCENFIEVLNTATCGNKFQPKHYCDYASVCPSPRFKTCDDCRKVLPSCGNQTDGIHGNPPGKEVTSGFMYCVEGRVLATSPCPPGTLFYESVKSCERTSGTPVQ